MDEMLEMVKQLVKDPVKQSLFFALWSIESGNLGRDSNIAQDPGQVIAQDQGNIIIVTRH